MIMQAPSDFPVHALPSEIRDAIWEVQRNTLAPLGLIASSALTSMSLTSQGLANVKRMDGLESPVTLWFLTVAESGERKTAIDSKFLSVIREFEAGQVERFTQEFSAYEAAMAAWHIEEKTILQAIKKDIENNEDCLDHLKERLIAHHRAKPKKPRRVKIIYNDVTPSAIKRGLSENWPSVGIVSDEGSGLLNSRIMADLSWHNSMWGGSSLTFDRVDACIVVPEPRLTFSVQIQPGPLKRYYDRKGEEVQDTGFGARFLISYPLTTQGGRFIQNPVTSWEYLSKFNARIRELLNMNVRSDGEPTDKITLSFTPEAQARWIDAYNAIEADLNPGRYYCGVKEYAAKIADNLARMAALFHLFEGREGPISLGTLEQAITVMVWYTNEFVRLFSPPPPVPQEQTDAFQLEIFLAQQIMRANELVNLKRNYIQQYGPNALRTKARLSAVLDILFSGGKISFSRVGKTTWILLNPAYFTPQHVQFLCAQGALK